MKVLVTGGTGYIGSHTVVSLIENGYTPIIVDDLSNSDRSTLKNIEKITGKQPIFYEGSTCFSEIFTQIALDHPNIESVIHFAAYKSVADSVRDPLAYYRNNIDSLLTTLDFCFEKNIETFIFSSSATVYGEQLHPPFSEDMDRLPATNPYGNTKSIAEDILRDATASSKHFRAVALRYFNPIGAHPSGQIGESPHGTPANLVPYLTQAAAGTRPPLTIYGNDYDTPDGTGVRDYIHVCDLADAHVHSLRYTQAQQAPFYDVLNVGTGNGTSVMELVKAFEEVTGKSVPHTFGPRRPGDIAKCWASNNKIQKTLSWSSKFTISDALKHAWQWQERADKS